MSRFPVQARSGDIRAERAARDVHDRMPVLLDPADHDRWLVERDRVVPVPCAGGLVIDPPARGTLL